MAKKNAAKHDSDWPASRHFKTTVSAKHSFDWSVGRYQRVVCC